MNPLSNEYVTASELGDFIFCKRGWWLKHNGLLTQSDAMIRGIQKHNSIAGEISSAQLQKRVAISLFLTGLLIVLVVIIFTLFM